MKTHQLLKSAAAAALLGLGVSAYAAGITVGTGDIILGFQDSTNSIQFDLTNISPVLNALDGSTHLIGNVNTALSYSGSGTTGYGATWASSSAISWGIAGRDATDFYTAFRQINDAPSATLSGGAAVANGQFVNAGDTPTAQSSLATMVSAMASMAPGAQLKAGGGTILAAKYVNSSNSSFAKIDPNTTGVAFGTFQNGSLLQSAVTATTVGTAGVLSGLTYSALDLYGFTGALGDVTNTFLGTLALTSGGDVYFTAAFQAIPEPSTYAAILGVVTLGFAAIRRRKQRELVA